jgi:hypothetical protein
MQDLTPLQIAVIYQIQKIINEEKANAVKNAGRRKPCTIEEYRRRKEGSNLYTEPATPDQVAYWEKLKERLQTNPIIAPGR